MFNTNLDKQISKSMKNKRLLVVGAGGIGCELIKCLVMSGYRNLTIVDLDKIEKSNLNRQFLFNKECIGQYKSEMAKLSILKSRNQDKELRLESFVGNIKDKTKFDINFFKSFDIVLNALDNIDARTYINIICIENRIPLVNSGTEGYLGNVASHLRDRTPCYNCIPKKKQKTIPVCSIRTKPEKIEHCVAWAKSLFELLFTGNSGSNHLEDYKIEENPKKNFQNYFYYNIIKENLHQLDMVDPLDIQKLIEFDFDDIENDSEEFNYKYLNRNINIFDDNTEIINNKRFLIFILYRSNVELIKIKNTSHLEKFDKENKEIVNFVFASSCLRAMNFKIKTETRFKIKELAGNIIPAIASTNGIIAAVQTIETMKVLQNKLETLRNVSLSRDKKIASVASVKDEKSENCSICSNSAIHNISNTVKLVVNLDQFTLENLISIVKLNFQVEYPQIYIGSNLLFESGDDLDIEDEKYYSEQLMKLLSNFNLKSGDNLQISDLNQKKYLNVIFENDSNYLNGEHHVSDEVNEYTDKDYEDRSNLSVNDGNLIPLNEENTEVKLTNNKRKSSRNVEGDEFYEIIKKRRIES